MSCLKRTLSGFKADLSEPLHASSVNPSPNYEDLYKKNPLKSLKSLFKYQKMLFTMFYDHSVIYHFCLLNQLTHVLYTVEKKDIGIAVLNRENIATSLSATHANIKTTFIFSCMNI